MKLGKSGGAVEAHGGNWKSVERGERMSPPISTGQRYATTSAAKSRPALVRWWAASQLRMACGVRRPACERSDAAASRARLPRLLMRAIVA